MTPEVTVESGGGTAIRTRKITIDPRSARMIAEVLREAAANGQEIRGYPLPEEVQMEGLAECLYPTQDSKKS